VPDKEELRGKFGWLGDYSPDLAAVYGDAYLDSPGCSGDFYTYLKSLSEKCLESARDINCHDNQQILIWHLRALRQLDRRSKVMSSEQNWESRKHMYSCSNNRCHLLNDEVVAQDEMNNME
jgi:hypothetical protein